MVARHLGNIEQARVIERVTERLEAITLQALLILVLQQLMAQALAGVILSPHLSLLRRQLIRQSAAIANPILRATSKAIP